MSDQLSKVVAEMRTTPNAFGWSNRTVLQWADRIESAAAPVEVGERHVRHEGGGVIALYEGDQRIREIGVAFTTGWDHRDRDEFIVRYNEHATLARQLAEAKASSPRYHVVEAVKLGNSELVTAEKVDALKMTNLEGWRLAQQRGIQLEQAESQLAEATRRLGEVERSARVNESLERAAEELPSGWLVTVIVEKHAGWVELTDPHGNTDPIDDDEGSLATAVHTAIDLALTKESPK